MHQSTKGGSSETEAKLLTVIPIWDASAAATVITAMPVGKHPKACRKALVSKGFGASPKVSITHPKCPRLHTRLRGVMHDPSEG